ncbi:MAG TPA: polymer-forming cytoskeletal protein [Gammaproteobacteria bacterium]|jgi:cytoskeletal protein CcmA (bactofilin family)|nr:polymer-forming cytoskeletal protein [Gammaproteobacteria bacterium]
MFSSGDNKQTRARIDTLIGKNSRIDGDLRYKGGLHVDGEIRGNVHAEEGSDSMLSLSQHGTIRGEVKVPVLVVNGTVEGDVHADKRLELGPEARITGDVYYNLIQIAVGATVNGKLVHKPAGPVLAVHNPKKPAEPEAKRG